MSPIPNSKEIVASIDSFSSQNYRIIPRFCHSFVINEQQYLPIYHESRYLNISLSTYERLTNKNDLCLVHQGVEFRYLPIALDPYILGLWFANQTTATDMVIRKSNIMIIFYLHTFIDKFNIQYTEYDDYVIITDPRILTQMNKYNLLDSWASSAPVIPMTYKYNMKGIRAKFLEGFIDNSTTDTEIAIENKTLKDDIVFIAHSLGLLTTSRYKDKIWYVTVINNTTDLITQHKNDFRIAKIPNSDALRIGIVGTMSPAILLGDFTVI